MCFFQPPRPVFWAQVCASTDEWRIGAQRCQIVATVIAGTVQLAVQSWMFSNIPYALIFDTSPLRL